MPVPAHTHTQINHLRHRRQRIGRVNRSIQILLIISISLEILLFAERKQAIASANISLLSTFFGKSSMILRQKYSFITY